jgi:hypothetical protein
MLNNQDEELGYVSSAPAFINVDPKQEVNANDEADMPALIKVLTLIEDRKAYYHSVDCLDAREDGVSLKNQLLINEKVVHHLDEMQALVMSAIGKVKEAQYNG